jgi:hypothetical protein
MRFVMGAVLCLALAPQAFAQDVWWPNIGFRGPEREDLGQPSMRDPGPDTADLPDSAFTVKPGVLYVETALIHASSKESPRTREYATPTLLRYGLNDRLELRLSGFLVHEHVPDGDSRSGVGPLTIGFKRHMWEEQPDIFFPAFGIIAQVSAPTSSAGFDSGRAEPTVYFNFDYSPTERIEFEWNGGLAWLEGDDGEMFFQGQFLWTVGRTWGREGNFKTFFHGVALTPGASGNQEEVVLGPGMVLFRGNRLAYDASYNFGVTGESPHRFIRLGMAMAF